MKVKDLQRYLATMPDDADVVVDDTGSGSAYVLCPVVSGSERIYDMDCMRWWNRQDRKQRGRIRFVKLRIDWNEDHINTVKSFKDVEWFDANGIEY